MASVYKVTYVVQDKEMPPASQKPCWAPLICMAKYLNFAGRLGFCLVLTGYIVWQS